MFFHGEYKPEDRYTFVRNTDLIHNIYKDGNMMLAMGNKYYDGLIFYIPQLCMKGSFMGEKCTEKGIGFECDPFEEDFAKCIVNYYEHIDFTHFKHQCDKEINGLVDEYNNGKRLCNKIFS